MDTLKMKVAAALYKIAPSEFEKTAERSLINRLIYSDANDSNPLIAAHGKITDEIANMALTRGGRSYGDWMTPAQREEAAGHDSAVRGMARALRLAPGQYDTPASRMGPVDGDPQRIGPSRINAASSAYARAHGRSEALSNVRDAMAVDGPDSGFRRGARSALRVGAEREYANVDSAKAALHKARNLGRGLETKRLLDHLRVEGGNWPKGRGTPSGTLLTDDGKPMTLLQERVYRDLGGL